MGRLTTHILDATHGKPGDKIKVSVYAIGAERKLLKVAETNSDGRVDKPLLEGAELVSGVYEIEFAIGAYYKRMGVKLPDPPFVGDVVLRFGVANADQHYHVPLLVSPFAYSTYRGS